jgi:hypothetical protein
MGVTVKSTNNIPRLIKVLKKLGKKEIKVGVFGSDGYKYGDDADLVTIAYVHEFGQVIRPKKAKWLTIPLIPLAKGKRAKDFPDLVFYKADDDTAFLALDQGKGKPMLNVFLLVKSVTIPERSFLRTGFDQNVDKIYNKIEDLMNDVLNFDINPDVFLDGIGMEFAGLIQKHMMKLKDPPKSKITLGVSPGKTNPLQDTGRLIGAIRHEVE